jgi:hypothetical protein
MNIQKYIETGVLESYVMGTSSIEESADVESMALKYPEIEFEINIIRNVFEYCALQRQPVPAVLLKNKIMNKIFGDND